MRLAISLFLLIVLTGCSEDSKFFQIHNHVGQEYLDRDLFCEKPLQCNGISRIDCGSDFEGPVYYLNSTTEELISTCGGRCWGIFLGENFEEREKCLEECPPRGWNCPY